MLVWTMLQIPSRWAAAIACASLCFFSPVVDAADRPIPEVVNVKTFAAAQDGHLDLLIRMPLAAVKDIQFPLRGDAGFIELSALQTMLTGASKYWVAGNFDVFNHGTVLTNPDVLAARISIISDRSFNSYEDAVAHFKSPALSADEDVSVPQVWLDVHLRYALDDKRALIVEPRVASLGVNVTTEFVVVEPNGGERVLSFEGNPGLVYLEPRWHEAFGQFLARGFRLIIGNADFLVFLFCLALPFRRYLEAVPATTTFAVAVSLGLLAAAFGFVPHSLWVRSLTDTLTAAAIVLVAAANIVNKVGVRTRALFALVVGAIFGLLSAFRLDDVEQFAGGQSAIAAAAYTIGIILAIVLAIALFIPLLRFLFSFARVETIERIIVSALAADTAWSWLVERWSQFRRIPFQPELEDGLLATMLYPLVIVIVFGGLLWYVNDWLKSHGFASDKATLGERAA